MYRRNYRTKQCEIKHILHCKLQYYNIIRNPRWQMTAIGNIVKSPYLSEISTNFDEIWYANTALQFKEINVINIVAHRGQLLLYQMSSSKSKCFSYFVVFLYLAVFS